MHFSMTEMQLYRIRARAKIERRYFSRRLSPRSCIVTSASRAGISSIEVHAANSFRLLSQPIIIWCDISWKCVTAAVCYYAAIRERRVVLASNYRSHGVIIAIVIRSRGEAKKVRTRGSLNETCNVDPSSWSSSRYYKSTPS